MLRRYKTIDLFSGCGGMSLGFQNAGFEILAAYDISLKKQEIAQRYTENYYNGLNNWEGIYVGEWNTHIISHSNPNGVGMITREGDSLKALQDAMTQRNGLYNAGIIVSPYSGELILSMYCPVFDTDGKKIVGYVGGGPYVEEIEKQLNDLKSETDTIHYYMVNTESNMYIFADDSSLIATDIQDEMLLIIIKKSNPVKQTVSLTTEKTLTLMWQVICLFRNTDGQ